MVDSNEQIKLANEKFKEKKEHNDKLFIELCYKDLSTAIEMHLCVMHHIKKTKEQNLIDSKNKLHQEKEEAAYSESLRIYNEAINKLQFKDKDKTGSLADQIKSLLDSILKNIYELNSYIGILDAKLAEINNELRDVKQKLSWEINEFFTGNNSSINIRTQSLSISLPASNENPNEKINVEIDKNTYLRFTESVAKNMGEGNFDFSLLTIQAKELATDIIRKEILRKLAHLPREKQEAAMKIILIQSSQEVERIALQLVNQFIRDMSKRPAMATLVKVGCGHERDAARVSSERRAAIIKRDAFVALAAKVAQSNLSPSNANSAEIKKTIATTQSNINKLMNEKDPIAESTLTALEKTDDSVNKIEELREHARTALKEDPTTTKVAECATKIPLIAIAHQLSLSQGLDDFFSPTDTNQPRQSKRLK